MPRESWKQARTEQAGHLAEVALKLGALDKCLKRGPDGKHRHLAFKKTGAIVDGNGDGAQDSFATSQGSGMVGYTRPIYYDLFVQSNPEEAPGGSGGLALGGCTDAGTAHRRQTSCDPEEPSLDGEAAYS